MKNRATVIGAGSWGTALAGVLSRKGIKTYLWGHNPSHLDDLRQQRQNVKYLPGMEFNEHLLPCSDLASSLKDSAVIVMVVPSQCLREAFSNVCDHITCNCCIVSAIKGIENSSMQTMTQVMDEVIRQKKIDHTLQIGVLSGPSFAREVADSIPTAVTVGFNTIETVKRVQHFFGTDYFRVYGSTDILGLELSAAFKNIIAIATGICDGLGYGLNTRAALITRGLAEITRFGIHLNADPLTFSGLSGMGDLILTCTGELSRNRHVGIELGKGKKLKDILKSMNNVAEGVKTTKSGYQLAQKNNVEMPILEQVYKILYENKPCSIAVQDLLSRELKEE